MKVYPEYKSFGIESLGDIPAHWKINKLNRICYMKGRIGWQGLKQSEFTSEGPYLITGMNFKDGIIRWDEVYHITEERYNEAPEIQLKVGDVLMTKDGTIGKLLYVDHLPDRASLNSHLLVLRPLENVFHPRYLYHLFDSSYFKDHIELYKTGTTFFGITQEGTGKFKMLLPPLIEQFAISTFLDNYSKSITDLVDKKIKMIELLRQERAAAINRALTRGLNHSIPMKDSGISWLGEIPKHWNIIKLKYISKIKYGLGQPPRQILDGIPLIRATNIERGKITDKDLIKVDSNDVPYERDPVLKTDDIIVVRSGAYTGDSAIIPEEYDGSIAGYDMVVRVDKANSKLVAWSFLSNYILENQLHLQRLRAAQPHLNAEELGETLIVLPPNKKEQDSIVEYINNETEKIEFTISRIEKEIDLLQEYRTALISEVVTGKVDVRDEAIL
jgi:type I restriction enzyme S subunit